eukprot:GEMP01034882.1.p1 GENE.GEMP01034882.1~~GEMP01034882.1.p1  ORF type:complete len:394 (+),score=68.28 GEMP01034882.1:25-1182(+)
MNLRGLAAISGTLLFGTLTTISSKAMYQTNSVGEYNFIHSFSKPWFAVWAMFVGMSFSLPVFFISKQLNLLEVNQLQQGLLEDQPTTTVNLRTVGRCCIPALCDLTATALCATGLLYTSASAFSMLRGAGIVFTAILSVIFLKRTLGANQVVGLTIVLPSLIVIGYASSAGSADEDSSATGVLFIILGQAVQASQYVLEEKLMKGVKVHPFLLLGIEGVFGTWLLLLVGVPILYSIHGSDMGSLENSLDTVLMLASSAPLMCMVAVYVLSIWGLNMCTVMCTKIYSSIVRTMLQQGVRSAFVWVVDLTLFYSFLSREYGEPWTEYSLMQAVGFACFMFGVMLYMDFIDLSQFLNLEKFGKAMRLRMNNRAIPHEFGNSPSPRLRS